MLLWRNESHYFEYLIWKADKIMFLLQVIKGDARAWDLNGFDHEGSIWKDDLPNGLHVISGTHVIKDDIAADYVPEYIKDLKISNLTTQQLILIKAGKTL